MILNDGLFHTRNISQNIYIFTIQTNVSLKKITEMHSKKSFFSRRMVGAVIYHTSDTYVFSMYV